MGCRVEILSLSVHAQSLFDSLFPTFFIGKEICIVPEAESSGLTRPPVESDVNLLGKPEMLLAHALGQ